MASVAKVANGYRIRWRNPDRSAGSYTVEDKALAERLRAEAEVAERSGQPWIPPARRRPEGEDESLEEAAVAWIRAIDGTKSDRTVTLYATQLEAALPALGRRVGDLTTERVREAVKGWRAAGLAPATISLRLSAIHGFAKHLAKGERRDRMEEIREIKVKRPPPAPVRVGFREIDTIISYLGLPGSPAYLFGVIARCTGLRSAEIQALTWGMFHALDKPAEATLTIPHGITKGGASGRVVPVAPVLATYLQAVKPDGARPEGRVMPWAPSVPHVAHRIRAAMLEAIDAGDLPEALRDASRAHLFRAALMQGLKRLRADHDAVETLVGHKIGVRGHYYHLEEAMREAVAMVPPLPVPPSTNVVQMRGKRRA
jgi:integrase